MESNIVATKQRIKRRPEDVVPMSIETREVFVSCRVVKMTRIPSSLNGSPALSVSSQMAAGSSSVERQSP